MRTRSFDSGFSMKSKAPARVASTATETVACPEIITTENGKQRRVYRRWETPWETFCQLPAAAGYLKPNLSLSTLARQAQAHSDTESARQMQEAKQRLFASFRTQKRSAGEKPRGSRK